MRHARWTWSVLLLSLSTPLAGQTEIAGRAASITIGGRLHTQFATSSVEDQAATLFIRRARVEVDVRVGDFIEARVMPDFAGGTTALQDVYARLNFAPAFRASIGQFKRAFSAFELHSGTDLPIIERDGRVQGMDVCGVYPDEETPDQGVGGVCTFSRITQRLEYDGRDLGLRVEGALGERLSYLATLTNGQGVNRSDVNDAKSVSGRLQWAAAEGVTLGVFGAVHDYAIASIRPDEPADDTDYGNAVGADLEVGTWRSGLHLVAALATGDTWRLEPEATFLAAQGMVTYYVDTGRPRLAGVEPLLRVSWADANRDQADDAGVLLTPGLMLYFVGKNGLAANLDFYSPEGDQDSEWSFKVQSFIYF